MKERYYVLYDPPFAPHPNALFEDPWVEAESGEEAMAIMKERVERGQAAALAREALKKEGKAMGKPPRMTPVRRRRQ